MSLTKHFTTTTRPAIKAAALYTPSTLIAEVDRGFQDLIGLTCLLLWIQGILYGQMKDLDLSEDIGLGVGFHINIASQDSCPSLLIGCCGAD